MDVTTDRAATDRDAGLLTALRCGEAAAAEHLVATFGHRAYRLAIGITGNQQDAEEAVQDALWSVIHKIDTFRGESSLGSWIYRITANAAYGKRRGRSRRRNEVPLDEDRPSLPEDGHYAHPIVDWSATINERAIQSELRDVVASALDDLPAHYRAVIVLHEVEELSMAEVADSLDITVPTAKSRAHRARLFLRKRLAVFIERADDSQATRNGFAAAASQQQ